tara:strand:+ start:944 stop:1423 length:480 start_codon:yes stop_codon:yes gene_type:complete
MDFNINFIKMKKMKKIILSCLCVFALSFTYGQGTSSSSNLGFNQVLNYNYSASPGSAYSWTSAGTLSVPANKVHKITSGSAYRYYNGDKLDYSAIKVGEHIVFTQPQGNNAAAGTSILFCPIWLSGGSQGTDYQVYLYSANASSTTLKGSLSIVEFNIE